MDSDSDSTKFGILPSIALFTVACLPLAIYLYGRELHVLAWIVIATCIVFALAAWIEPDITSEEYGLTTALIFLVYFLFIVVLSPIYLLFFDPGSLTESDEGFLWYIAPYAVIVPIYFIFTGKIR